MLAPDGRSDPASRNAGHDRVRRAWPRPCGRTTLLFTRNMGKYFRISIGLSLYDDVLISFLIDRLLAVLAKYDFGHLKAPLTGEFNVEIAVYHTIPHGHPASFHAVASHPANKVDSRSA